MRLVWARPMFFAFMACAAGCAGCGWTAHKSDQTHDIELTAGDYCRSKGQKLVKTGAGGSEVFNCVPDDTKSSLPKQ